MTKKEKIFLAKRRQAARLPKEFQFKTHEVFIRKDGEEAVLSPRFADWSDYLTRAPIASPAFMENVEELPMQKRSR